MRLYPHSPLVEVVFEIHGHDSNWNITVPGTFYNIIQKKFKIISEAPAQIGFMIGSDMKMSPPNIVQPTRFFNEERDSLVQIAPTMLSINKLQPYKGWLEFEKTIKWVLEKYHQARSIDKFNKVSLRYLNKINSGQTHSIENIKHFLKYYPFLPEGFENVNSAQSIVESRYRDDKDVLAIAMGTLNPDETSRAPLLLDLTYQTVPGVETNYSELLTWVESAHNCIKSTFESLITEELRKLIG